MVGIAAHCTVSLLLIFEFRNSNFQIPDSDHQKKRNQALTITEEFSNMMMTSWKAVQLEGFHSIYLFQLLTILPWGYP